MEDITVLLQATKTSLLMKKQIRWEMIIISSMTWLLIIILHLQELLLTGHMVEVSGLAAIRPKWFGLVSKINLELSQLFMEMILEPLMLLFMNYYQKWRRVEFNSQNTQCMESSQLAPQIWELVKDSQSWVNSPTFLTKVLMRRNSNNRQRKMVFRQEELEESTLQWIKKVLQTFHHLQDLE